MMKRRICSLLLCLALLAGLLPAGMLTAAAETALADTPASVTETGAQPDLAASGAQAEIAGSGELYYTNPATPYVAMTYEELYKVFDIYRSDGKKIYIQLGADIKHVIQDGDSFQLRTNGADVELDINGHDLYVIDTREHTYQSLIYGEGSCTVTIVDSVAAYSDNVYETQKGIRYEFLNVFLNVDASSPTVLGGNIIVKSGYIQNRSFVHVWTRESYVYYGDSLKVYGGIFDAPTPVHVFASETAKSVIYGGTFRVKGHGNFGFDIGYLSGESYNIPLILNCKITDYSQEYVRPFHVSFSNDIDSESKAFEAFRKMFPYVTSVTKDGASQSSITSGAEYYPLSNYLWSPSIESYTNGYQVRSKTLIEELYVLTAIPFAWNTAGDFDLAVIYSGDGYRVDTGKNTGNWHNGVMWKHGVNGKALSSSDTFEVGMTYTVYVSLVPTDTGRYAFAPSEDIKAWLNGSEAKIYKYSDADYGVFYTVTIPDPVIHEVYVDVPEPKAGDGVTYHAEASMDDPYQVADVNTGAVWESGVCWKEDGAILCPQDSEYFEPGHDYTVSILVDLRDPVHTEFSTGMEFEVFVNGRHGTYTMVSDTRCSVSYTFSVTKNLIDAVAVTMAEPNVTDPLYYSAYVAPAFNYEVEDYTRLQWKNGVAWYDSGDREIYPSENAVFKPGETYTVYVLLKPKDTVNYTFDKPKNVEAAINGRKATVDPMSGGGIRVGVSYTMPDTAEITEVALSGYTAPVVGQTAGENRSTIAFLDGAPYHWRFGSAGWLEVETNNFLNADEKFKDGMTYILTLHLEADEPYTFSSVVTYFSTVNGSTDLIDYSKTYVWSSEAKYMQIYTVAITPEAAAVTGALLGDVDGDGKVDIFDAASIQKSLAGKTGYVNYKTLSADDLQFRIADVDGDGKVDIYDVSLIQKWMAGNAAAQTYGIGDPI